MRIVFVLTVGIERPSGRRYFALARELVHAGYQVHILALHPDYADCHVRRFTSCGVEVQYVGQMHVRKRDGRIERFGPLRLLQVLLHSSSSLLQAIRQTPADIYHLGKPQPLNGVAALLALRVRGQPYLLDCDDDEAGASHFAASWQQHLFAFVQRMVVAGAAGLSVNTTTLARRWMAAHRPLVRVPNGADLALFTAPSLAQRTALRQALGIDQAPLIVYAGTLALHSHAVDLLLSAFALVQLQVPQVRLLLIGSGPDQAALQASVAQQPWRQRVIWSGEVTVRQTAALLALADVSVDPVRDDATARARAPLKLVESLALGVPVVTSPIGDRAEWLAAGSGLLVPPDDAAALASALRQLLTDRALHAECVAAAARQRDDLSWRRQVQPLLALYRQCGYAPPNESG